MCVRACGKNATMESSLSEVFHRVDSYVVWSGLFKLRNVVS